MALSTRGLVLGGLLPSRPQERFRTWPRLVGLGDLGNFRDLVPTRRTGFAAALGYQRFTAGIVLPQCAAIYWNCRWNSPKPMFATRRASVRFVCIPATFRS